MVEYALMEKILHFSNRDRCGTYEEGPARTIGPISCQKSDMLPGTDFLNDVRLSVHIGVDPLSQPLAKTSASLLFSFRAWFPR